MRLLFVAIFLISFGAVAQISIPSTAIPTPTPNPGPVDSLTGLETLTVCKTGGSNPFGSKTRAIVKKSKKDGRIFAHVELTKFGGIQIVAQSIVKELRTEEKVLPVEFKGDTIKVSITEKRKETGYFGGAEEYWGQIVYTDFAGLTSTESVLCQINTSGQPAGQTIRPTR